MEACTQWSGHTAISGKTEGRHQEMLYLHCREHRLQIQAPRPRAKTSCLTAAPGYLQPLPSPLSPSPALQRRVSQSRTALISQQDLLSTGTSLWRGHTLPPLEQCTLRFPSLGRGYFPRPVEDPTVEIMLTLHISLVPALKLVSTHSLMVQSSDSSQSTLVSSSQMLYRTWPFWLPGLSKGSSLSQIPFYLNSTFILATGLTEIIFQGHCSVIPLTAQLFRSPTNNLSQKAATFPHSGCISASVPPAGAEQGLRSYSAPSEAITWKQTGQWIWRKL